MEKHYGKESNYYFKSLEEDDYDVFVLETQEDDYKCIPIPEESSNHFCYIDSCITWACYFIERNYKNKNWYCVKIQNPDTEVEKKYYFFDSMLEDLWRTFIDVTIDEEECIEQNWFIFEKGTNREYIWHWFDERYSNGIAYLMYELEC